MQMENARVKAMHAKSSSDSDFNLTGKISPIFTWIPDPLLGVKENCTATKHA